MSAHLEINDTPKTATATGTTVYLKFSDGIEISFVAHSESQARAIARALNEEIVLEPAE